jgi:Sporulation and spore germination
VHRSDSWMSHSRRGSVAVPAPNALVVLAAILLAILTGCGAVPFNLPGQSGPTRVVLPTLVNPITIVITATLPPSPPTEPAAEPTATPIPLPTSPPPTVAVQAAPTQAATTPTSVPAGGGTTQVKIFLIAVGDNGVSGPKIGCGDSAVGVVRVVPATKAPLTAALNELLSLHDQNYGQSGLYNSLYQSHLRLESVAIAGGVATIKLTGTLLLGGVCDDPRVDAQLTNTALQFSTVHSVDISLNGKPLKDYLSGK